MGILARLKNALRALTGRGRAAGLRRLGDGTEIEPGVRFVFPERIEVGAHVYIGPGGYLNGRGDLIIEDHVIIAPEVAVMTSMHRFRGATMVPYDEVEVLKPVRIGRCVWVGMRVMIMPGVEIGEGSVIGAGSVVTRSCPPGTILAGNPAREIAKRDMAHYAECVADERFYLKTKRANRLQKVEQKG